MALSRTGLTSLAVAALAACGGGSSPLAPSPAPPPAATRDGRLVQDIDALVTDLPRLHANLFFKTSRASFESEAASLKARVGELRDHEVVAGLMRLAALPGDGHTSISPFNYSGFRRLPIRLRAVSDGLIVASAAPGGEGLLGGRIVQIGDTSQSAAMEKIAPLISRDNEAGLRAMAPGYLTIPELLHAQGIVPDPGVVRIRIVRPDGSPAEATLTAMAPGTEGTFVDAATPVTPLHRQRSQENYWFTLTNENILYMQYNRCQEAAGDPMASFAQRVMAEVDRRAPVAVVIDLRANGGGSSSVIDPLLQGLRSRSYLAQSGRLFALIGSSTFSSALMNAITLKRELGAVLVGEPTGGRPNGYGEVKSFALPNSGLNVSYSTKFFRSWPDGDPESLEPDVPAAISSADYQAGRDPALEAIARRLGISGK